MGNEDLSARLAKLSPAKRALLERQMRERSTESRTPSIIPRRSVRESAPLSFAQQRLWFLNQLEPESSVYNEPHAVRLSGILDLDAFRQALNQIILRHEVLRTTMETVDGSPRQVVAGHREVDLPVIDLQSLPEPDRNSEARRLMADAVRKPFNLSRDLMFRALMLRLAEREYIFLVVRHHIASDGWSTGILWQELSAVYRAIASGEPLALPELKIQYADYAVWQRDWLRGEILEKQLTYWKEQLTGLGALQLPTDRPRPPVQSYRGSHQSLRLSDDLSEKLNILSRKERTTLFMILLAAFQTLLYRYTGQEDIAVGCPIAGRVRPELESLMGFFVNTLVMRVNFSDNPTFRELLAQVREVALGAYEHQDIPFEKLVEELQPERDLSHSPLFQVALAYQNTPNHSLEIPDVLVTPLEKSVETAKFDLQLSVNHEDKGIRATLYYSTDLYDGATITRMLGHFRVLLEGIVENSARRVSELPLLTEAEKRQLLVVREDQQRDYSQNKCLHQLFEEQAERTPDAIAIVFEEQRITYGELNRRANKLARYLRKLGVGSETLVGICMERSVEVIAGMLGILKAGGAYVPLDPEYPKERLAFMLEDAQIAVLLTQEQPARKLPDLEIRLVCLDRDWPEISQESAENITNETTAESLAYVIYTSGTTGKPKGAMISHRNVDRLFRATEPWFHFTGDDVWTVFHSYAFDFSVWEIWGAFLTGGRAVIVPLWMSRSPEQFYELLGREQVTVLNQTPSSFRQLIQADQDLFHQVQLALRWVISGGEALDFQSLQPWFDRHGDQHPQVVNMYGITETTVHVTYRPIKASDMKPFVGSLIGVPLPDLELYVLDQHRQPAPVGIPGELYVGGSGVARGYLNRPELTDARFVPNPFNESATAKLYKTGDLVRRLNDGDIEFLGRIDDQVKIRGYRIELGEIEATLARHPEVRMAAVLAREDTPGDKRLAAYIVPREHVTLRIDELRCFLKDKLPEYMVPSAFVILDRFPLTSHGKIDRQVLPLPEKSRPESKNEYDAPQTPVAQLIAEIWGEVLRLDRIGIHDNFFDLGGHSLKATLVMSRVRESFQMDLPLRVLFEAPTVAELALRVQQGFAAAGNLEARTR